VSSDAAFIEQAPFVETMPCEASVVEEAVVEEAVVEEAFVEEAAFIEQASALSSSALSSPACHAGSAGHAAGASSRSRMVRHRNCSVQG
jgi:hypothetical protein